LTIAPLSDHIFTKNHIVTSVRAKLTKLEKLKVQDLRSKVCTFKIREPLSKTVSNYLKLTLIICIAVLNEMWVAWTSLSHRFYRWL